MRLTLSRYLQRGKALRSRVAASDGVVLLWALLIMFVLLVTTAGAANLITSNEAAFGRDNSSISALDIAEAGLNAAFAEIAAQTYSTQPGPSMALTPGSGTLEGGRWSYTASAIQSTTSSTSYTWTVISTGVLADTTHIVEDKLSQTIVPSTGTQTQTTTTPQWPGYGYGVFLGAGTSDCAVQSPTGAVNTLGGSGTIDTSVFVNGSLCLSGSAQIQEPSTSSGGTVSVYVGGKLMTSNEASAVGTTTKKLASVTAVGGCIDGNHTTSTGHGHSAVTTYDSVPCAQQGTPLSSVGSTGYGSGVYANSYSSTQQTLTKPTVDPTYWYSNAEPGPAHGCNSYGASVSTYPTGWNATTFDHDIFDNDATRNTSIPSSYRESNDTIDLGRLVSQSASGQAANSFDCKYFDASGNLQGELKFIYPASGSESSSNPGYLYINGAVFVDGNLDFEGNDFIEYTGKGVIYVNGTVTIQAGASICAVPVSGAACHGNFNSSANLLDLVAINANNASPGWSMQGAGVYEGMAYTNGAFSGANGSVMDGPVTADTGTFSGANAMSDTFAVPVTSPGAASTTSTTTTTTGPSSASVTPDPGTWQQLQ